MHTSGVNNKVALVTGGSAGIGKAICEEFLAQDYQVISLDQQEAGLTHPKLSSFLVDLSNRDSTAQVLTQVMQDFEPTTVVHNAGVIRASLLPDVKFQDFDMLAQLHLGCAIQLMQAVLPVMRAKHFGRVVLMSSRAVLGLATRTSYSATKSAMLGMARTWALELAADGITVNVIAPGPIRTDMFYATIEPGSSQERALAAAIPVQRLGEPGDISRAVRFFADDNSSFITGQVLYVDGGTSVGSLRL
jgi:NAD(P)-dependent dehydrogenase (short-subunit alcohol dehydrogenase family)